MTLREAYLAATRRLEAAAVPTASPALDARVLLGHAVGLEPAALLARWPETLDSGPEAALWQAVDRRAAGEPVAWITGHQDFMGLDFSVGPGLLVPRADTETLVEAALALLAVAPPASRVVDVGTGTGCVAVALAALAPAGHEIWAVDRADEALAMTRRNAGRLLGPGRRVRVEASDLLTGVEGPWHLIVSNPPYLTPAETAERVGAGGWREPALALDGGGDDGLDLIRRLVAQAEESLSPGGGSCSRRRTPRWTAFRRS